MKAAPRSAGQGAMAELMAPYSKSLAWTLSGT